MLQTDAINTFEASLRAAFDADPKLKWIMVPMSYYTPKAPEPVPENEVFKLKYGQENYCNLKQVAKYHKVQAPIVVTSEVIRGNMLSFMIGVRPAPEPGHEIALGVTWVCGFEDTSTKYGSAQIFDAHPDLDFNDLPKNVIKALPKFTILSTGNSYHFYLKGNPLEAFNYTMQQVQNRLIDPKWDDYRSQSGGYIRVSSFVKGEIKTHLTNG